MVRGSNEGQSRAEQREREREREKEREREGAEEEDVRTCTNAYACVRACVRACVFAAIVGVASVAAAPTSLPFLVTDAVAGRPPPGPYDMIYQPRLPLCAPSLPHRSLFVRCPVSSRSSIAADAPRVRARTLRAPPPGTTRRVRVVRFHAEGSGSQAGEKVNEESR